MPWSWNHFRNHERSAFEAQMGKITIFFVNLKMTFARINVSWNSTIWSIGFWNEMLNQANGECVSMATLALLAFSLFSFLAWADSRKISKHTLWHLWMKNVGLSNGLITCKHWEILLSDCWERGVSHQTYENPCSHHQLFYVLQTLILS